MRAFVLLALLAAPAAFAQDPAAGAPTGCNVAPGPLDADASGHLVRQPPSAAECERASSLEAKFLATKSGQFRRTFSFKRVPEPVRDFLTRVARLDDPQKSVRVQDGPFPPVPEFIVWLSPELVVAAYRDEDFTGTSTSIFLADRMSLDACSYLHWPGGELPASLSVADVQRALASGALGEREAPDCHLKSLTID